MEGRSIYVNGADGESYDVVENTGYLIGCAMPIVSEGDVIGCILTAYPSEDGRNSKISNETEQKLIYTAGLFLGKQVEN